jgi:hypothetical protein
VLKLPVSLQIVLRALIEEGLKRRHDPAVFANVEGQAKAVCHIRRVARQEGERDARREDVGASVYYRTMSHVVVRLMRLTALAFCQDETLFDRKVHRSIGTMRLNRASPLAPGQLRASAHTD